MTNVPSRPISTRLTAIGAASVDVDYSIQRSIIVVTSEDVFDEVSAWKGTKSADHCAWPSMSEYRLREYRGSWGIALVLYRQLITQPLSVEPLVFIAAAVRLDLSTSSVPPSACMCDSMPCNCPAQSNYAQGAYAACGATVNTSRHALPRSPRFRPGAAAARADGCLPGGCPVTSSASYGFAGL